MKNRKQVVIFKFNEIVDDILNSILSNEIFDLVGDNHKYSFKTQKIYLNILIDGNSTISIKIPFVMICKFYKKCNYEVVDFEDEEALMMW